MATKLRLPLTNVIFTERIEKRAPQRLIKKWLKALRDGEYHQAQSQLREKGYEVVNVKNGEETYKNFPNKYAYCCLGVVCDLIDPKGWEKDGHKLGADGDRDASVAVSERESFLSPEALAMLGLNNHGNDRLADLNDKGRSFAEIADYIESQMKIAVS